jgi:hypothetical protein
MMRVKGLPVYAWLVSMGLVGVLCYGTALAQTVTVQVAALSEEDRAITLQRELVEADFPAYLESVTTETGLLYRLRVGAFANREAALVYADELAKRIPGTEPIPATAQLLPEGVAPLLPALVASYDYAPTVSEVRVVRWGDGYALRLQGSFEGEPLEAEYRVLSPELDGLPFRAWRAAPDEGVGDNADAWSIRISNLPLAPASSSGSERDDSVQASLEQIAQTMELDPEDVASFVRYTPGQGMPYVVIVERYNIATGATQSYDALGDVPAGMSASAGPSLTWFARSIPERLPMSLGETVLEPRAILGLNRSLTLLPEADELQLTGDGWQAEAEDGFARLALDDGTSWRALVGFPLWAAGDYLLTFANDELLLYRLE